MKEAESQKREHAKREAQREMLNLARRETTATYAQLAEKLTTRYAPMGKPFGRLLSEISEQTFRRDGVLLSAVIVHADDGLPGDGFFELAERLGEPVGDRKAFWENARAAVYEQLAGG